MEAQEQAELRVALAGTAQAEGSIKE